jgi:hypothetical protein
MSMAYSNNIAATYESRTKWVARPLNTKGNLSIWLEKMNNACPYPELGQIVWLNGYNADKAYKVIGFKVSGDVIWQRGEVIKH